MQDYPDYIKTVEQQCRQTIIDYSWKMVFAKDEEEFQSLKETMLSTLVRLGFDQVIDINTQYAQERYEILRKAAEGRTKATEDQTEVQKTEITAEKSKESADIQAEYLDRPKHF